jgi:hypothetical protein
MPYRETVPPEVAQSMATKVQQVITDRGIRGLTKASKYVDLYYNHVMKKIEKTSSKGFYWIVYGGPWWYPMNEYDATLLMAALKDKGFKADFTSNIHRWVKIQISWAPSS